MWLLLVGEFKSFIPWCVQHYKSILLALLLAFTFFLYKDNQHLRADNATLVSNAKILTAANTNLSSAIDKQNAANDALHKLGETFQQSNDALTQTLTKQQANTQQVVKSLLSAKIPADCQGQIDWLRTQATGLQP